MRTASAKELKQKTAALLREVRKGAKIGITYRGKTIATLVPAQPTEDRRFEPIGFGMWKGRKEMQQVDRWITKIRKPRYHR